MTTITSLAIQFAEANQQEQKWLREEIKQLKTIIAALCPLTIPLKDISRMEHPSYSLHFHTDIENRRLIIQIEYI